MMRSVPFLITLATTLAIGAAASRSAQSAFTIGDLRQYDLVTVGNLTSNSEVEGKTILGGDLNGSASNYAIKLNPSSNYTTVDTLVVGGNINATANVNSGSVLVGGSVAGHVNLNGGSGTTLTTHDSDLLGLKAQLQSQLNYASTTLAAMTSNSSITGLPTQGSQPGAVTFTASPNSQGVAIFSIDAQYLNEPNSIQQYILKANGASSIIINVTNTTHLSTITASGNFNGGDFGNGTTRQTILWNFGTASALSINSGFEGSVLAPVATLSNNSAIDGSVFTQTFNQTGEVHLPNSNDPNSRYTGIFPMTPVPEPGSVALMGLGGVSSLLVFRRRRRATV